MKTDTTEKGLKAHITQHLCLVNAFEERHFSQYNRVDCVDKDVRFHFLLSVDQLHSILDAVAEVFRTSLTEEFQEDFRAKCKTYVRLYVFLAQIIPFVNPYLERLYLFPNHLQNKLGRQHDEDLARGILDNIDSYQLQKEGEFYIQLEQGIFNTHLHFGRIQMWFVSLEIQK